jgi:eukaryotic-like serine/threonine-protein kinase
LSLLVEVWVIMREISDIETSLLRGFARFEIKHLLGEGGMGVVYEAFDKEKQSSVAIKTLKRLSPQGLLLFKNEFRSLTNLHHPNLIQLYELFSEEDLCFFSMELLSGQSFLSFIRRPLASSTENQALAQTLANPTTRTAIGFPADRTERIDSPSLRALAPTLQPNEGFDEGRLRMALAQLTQGVLALHAAGKIHRDIKPSNLMVTKEDRIVLMDFGLIREVVLEDERPMVVGTPRYMSPEQARGQGVGPESDWYSLGVILYQALTGELPFSGSVLQILLEKQQRDPASPRAHCSQLPEDLEALCMALLSRAPEKRPGGNEILSRLGFQSSGSLAGVLPSSPFVGRQAELAWLKELYQESQQKSAALCVFVHGESGIGKSALIDKFLASFPKPVAPARPIKPFLAAPLLPAEETIEEHFEQSSSAGIEVRQDSALTSESRAEESSRIDRLLASLSEASQIEKKPSALVLSGRCYEQESVPYKALDGVIDGLSHYLTKLEFQEAAQLLPRDASLLSRVFPVLRQVHAMSAFVPVTVRDPFELRNRVFSALRQLFAKLVERAPLVIFIDDLQWTDSDSLLLLSEILRPPAAPAFFLVASVRGRGLDDPPIAALVAKLSGVSIAHLQVGRLSPTEASALVRLLGSAADETDPRGEALPEDDSPVTTEHTSLVIHWSQETGGHPLFIKEMVRHQKQSAGTSLTKLENILLARVNSLEEDSRRIVELCAVSGAPLPQQLLAQAAGLSIASFYRRVLSLRATQLIRTGGLGEQDPIEPYHDRVREVVATHLDLSTRRDHHRKLAEVLALATHQDSQALMRHWEGANEPALAAGYAIQAAEQASTAMAFERAIDLYRDALRLGHYPKEEERRLRYLLGESLSYVGRGKEAAEAFLSAAEGASKAERLKCQTQVMRQLLSSGNMEDGLLAARGLLHEIGARWPENNAETIAALLWHRTALRLRGLHWLERDEASIPPEELLSLDVYENLSVCLGPVDTIRGALFHAISLRQALELGEVRRIVRGLARQASFLAVRGAQQYSRAWSLTREVRQQAEARSDPELLAWASLCEGNVSFFTGRAKEALPLLEDAERRFREQVLGSNAEFNIPVVTRVWMLRYLGSFGELARVAPEYLQDAVRRGDLYTENTLLRSFNILSLAYDKPEEVSRGLGRAWIPLKSGYHMQHRNEHIARSWLALYEGKGLSPELEDGFRKFSRSLLVNFECARTYSYFLQGNLLLAEARNRNRWARVFLLTEVERHAKGLCQIPAEYARAWGLLLKAGLARLRDQLPEAIGFFAQATQAADASGLQTEAAVARLRQGELVGGEQGRALITQAQAFMTREGIKNPTRFSQLYSPWV